MKTKPSIQKELFLSFFKIGAFTFGGGYAMIALLEEEFVTRKQWIESGDFLDMAAISESTPGPIAINCATYLGYQLAGIPGALLATLAVSLPAFLIMLLISSVLDLFLADPFIAAAFKGIQVCVIYLILNAGLRMRKKLPKAWPDKLILLCVLICSLVFTLFSIHFSSITFILISGLAGILLGQITGIGKEEQK